MSVLLDVLKSYPNVVFCGTVAGDKLAQLSQYYADMLEMSRETEGNPCMWCGKTKTRFQPTLRKLPGTQSHAPKASMTLRTAKKAAA